MTLLRLAGVTAGYGMVPVLFQVDLEVGDGETVALLGANGAGKTTLLRAISGVIPLRSGTIDFLGQRMDSWDTSRRVEAGLVHVPENRLIFDTLSVEENLRMGAHVLRRDARRLNEALDRAYTYFPLLRDRRGQIAGTLSGGEQQMLTLVRGLAGDPKLLAIDEASFGLAPQIVEQVFAIIHAIKSDGISILLVEQNVAMSLEVADRAYVLERGRMAFRGAAREIQSHPELVVSYLGGTAGTPKKPRRRPPAGQGDGRKGARR